MIAHLAITQRLFEAIELNAQFADLRERNGPTDAVVAEQLNDDPHLPASDD